jgi:hypothetical protein
VTAQVRPTGDIVLQVPRNTSEVPV